MQLSVWPGLSKAYSVARLWTTASQHLRFGDVTLKDVPTRVIQSPCYMWDKGGYAPFHATCSVSIIIETRAARGAYLASAKHLVDAQWIKVAYDFQKAEYYHFIWQPIPRQIIMLLLTFLSFLLSILLTATFYSFMFLPLLLFPLLPWWMENKNLHGNELCITSCVSSFPVLS